METFYWHTEYEHSNNNETMTEYLNEYLDSHFDILIEDGAYAEIQDTLTGELFVVHATTDNGDFYNHKVEFVKL